MKIANTPGMAGAALLVILQTPRREMPDIIIPARERVGSCGLYFEPEALNIAALSLLSSIANAPRKS
jgi:hypothetical protein